jgi:hypothetical protein
VAVTEHPMVTWLRAKLDDLESEENTRVVWTADIGGKTCPGCGHVVAYVESWGDGAVHPGPCGCTLIPEDLDELVGARPNPDLGVINRIAAERALLRLHGRDGRGECRVCKIDHPCWTLCLVASGHRHRQGYLRQWASGG